MSSHVKYGLPFLVLCTIAFLVFVNFVENNIAVTNYPVRTVNSLNDFAILATKENPRKLRDSENLEYTIRVHCRDSDVVWIVTSYAGDPAPRSALRRAYDDEELRKLGVTRVFLLGLLDDAARKKSSVDQLALQNEADRFRDIVQGNFNEAYRNLTLKHLMGLRWATENCPTARYIVKQDDDVVVNLYDIVKKLKSRQFENSSLAGYALRNMRPIREPANKWFVTNDEFNGDVYPDFLSGWLYIASRDAAKKIVDRCYSWQNLFWIDDVFLTGIIRTDLKIPLTDISDIYTTDYRFLSCCVRGRSKRLKCEFSVGPNGGKIELQVKFRDFAKFCDERCNERPKEFSVGKTCVVEYEESRVQMGSAKIEPIQFL